MLCLSKSISKCGSENADRCLQRPVYYLFLSYFLGLAVPKKLNSEMRVYRTKIGIVTFIFKVPEAILKVIVYI